MAPDAPDSTSISYEAESVEGSGGSAGYTTASGNVADGRKITFWASVSINTKNFDADYRAINDYIIGSGGYVASEELTDYTSYGRNEGRRTYLSVRVPAEGFEPFLDQITTVGEVTNKSKNSEDLTRLYFDTEARIEMLELRKERLMQYILEADSAADIVEFERELASVLYELDQYQGYKRQLDQLVDYSTVDIYLTELITPETIGKDGELLGERASSAFSMSVTNVRRFLENTVVFIAGAIPVLFLLGVFAAIIWAVLKVTRPKREKLQAARDARQAQRAQARMMATAPAAYVQPQPFVQQQASAAAAPPSSAPIDLSDDSDIATEETEETEEG
jgi:hypothetical protein